MGIKPPTIQEQKLHVHYM